MVPLPTLSTHWLAWSPPLMVLMAIKPGHPSQSQAQPSRKSNCSGESKATKSPIHPLPSEWLDAVMREVRWGVSSTTCSASLFLLLGQLRFIGLPLLFSKAEIPFERVKLFLAKKFFSHIAAVTQM